MTLSNPASDTAVSAISTSKADPTSALSVLAMQDPSIPTSGKCHIDRCATEIMIQVAESVDYKGLCSLARASKRYTEAAQDVLYRVVDLRPAGEDPESTFDSPTKSDLAVFLWTITQKPHLATKVQDLWFLPRSIPVKYPQLMYSGVSPVSPLIKPGSYVVKVSEKKLACDLLERLTELRSLTITALDDYLCRTELVQCFRDLQAMKSEYWITVLDKLLIHSEKLVDLLCFSKLTSIYLSHGHLDWAVVTLPTLRTLCIGSKATVELPSKTHRAFNITSLIVEAANNTLPWEFLGTAKLLVYLPNVKALTLGSSLPDGQHSRFPPPLSDRRSTNSFGNLGSFTSHYVRIFLALGRSVEDLKLTYTKPVRFCNTSKTRLEAKESIQLRRIQIAECALVDSQDLQRLEGSSPSQLLPSRIRTLVITHPRSPGPDDGDRKSKLTSWLGELTKTDFPDLERVEVVCSVGYGDGVEFKKRLEQSAEVRFLETIGVTVVIKKE